MPRFPFPDACTFAGAPKSSCGAHPETNSSIITSVQQNLQKLMSPNGDNHIPPKALLPSAGHQTNEIRTLRKPSTPISSPQTKPSAVDVIQLPTQTLLCNSCWATVLYTFTKNHYKIIRNYVGARIVLNFELLTGRSGSVPMLGSLCSIDWLLPGGLELPTVTYHYYHSYDYCNYYYYYHSHS